MGLLCVSDYIVAVSLTLTLVAGYSDKIKAVGIETIPSKGFEIKMADSCACPQTIQQVAGFNSLMSTDKSTYKPAEPVKLTFYLTNNEAEDAYVLKWHTPLEGVRNNFLTVTVNGEKVPYRGILAKRGNPAAESYILVPAGQCVSATIVLQKGYHTDIPGHYLVEMRPSLMDVIPKVDSREFKPRTLDELRSVDMACLPLEFDVVA